MTKATLSLATTLIMASLGVGCGAPAAPFNQMPQSQVTVLQLQNYEPPPQATAAPAAGGLGGLPIPADLAQMLGGLTGGMMGGGAAGSNGGAAANPVGAMAQPLCGLGIPFPGICSAAPTTPAATAQVQRFQGFRILGTAQLTEEGAKEDLAKILGKDGNFDNSNKPCLYPEYGISFGVPANDMLISFLCHSVDAKTFAWPHQNRGLSDDTQKKLAGAFKGLNFMPIQLARFPSSPMAKLYFRHGPVSSAKSMNLLAVAHNYRSQGKKVVLLKPRLDTRWGQDTILSRSGLAAQADQLVDADTSLDPASFEGIDCVLVDEAQFLSSALIEQLRSLTRKPGIPVICYGLRTDFRTRLFEGSRRLFELADSIEEVKVTCKFCNRKAIFNMRLVDGKPTAEGAQIELGGDEKYVPVCAQCYGERLPI